MNVIDARGAGVAIPAARAAQAATGERGPAWIDIDAATFEPWTISAVRHRLAEHPLLQLDAIAALGARLDARGSVRTHSSDAKPGTPFNSAPEMFPNTRSAVDTLASIGDARAWMSLLNVQIDDQYRALVDEVLAGTRGVVDEVDPGMCHRAGWIFVSSPNAVTPFHFDHEHNFILQVQGRKRVYVWDHRDTAVASEAARDIFHGSSERYLLRWRDEFRARARVFDLEPGQGAYMPSTSPHMVENGDQPSVTMSFTYYTDSTRRDAQLHRLRARLRRLRIVPPAVGSQPWLDTVLHRAAAPFAPRPTAFADVREP